jgi:phenylacetate-CoA ligase
MAHDMPRVFASPGPIYEPEGPPDYWRLARAMFAAGFRPGELIHNCFSYHFVPAGSMMETGAHALGCTVFAAGTGQTEQQVQAMAELRPAGYIGTPSFLKIIVEKAAAMGVAAAQRTKAMFGGEAFPPSLRDWFLARGVRVTSVLQPPTWG